MRFGAGGHGGDLRAVAAEFAVDVNDIIDFSSNINPLGPPPGLWEELRSHLDDINSYPEPQARTFRRALAGKMEIAENRLLPGNGANELIHLLCLWKRPRRVVFPVPAFAEYNRAARLAGAAVKTIPNSPDNSPDELLPLIRNHLSAGDLLIICNPENPTGRYYPREIMAELAAAARERKAALLTDESFFPFTGRPPAESMSPAEEPGLWVVTSLTKLWALPGLRLGYLTGPADEIQEITKYGDPWRVNTLAQRAGLFCLADNTHLSHTVEYIRRERDFMSAGLHNIKDITVFSGSANYLLARSENEAVDCRKLYRKLMQKKLLIRKADNFAGLNKQYFRMAIRSPAENKYLLQELASAFCRK